MTPRNNGPACQPASACCSAGDAAPFEWKSAYSNTPWGRAVADTIFSACGAKRPFSSATLLVTSKPNPTSFLEIQYADFCSLMDVAMSTAAQPVGKQAGWVPPFTCTLAHEQSPEPTATVSAVSMETVRASTSAGRRKASASPWVLWKGRFLLSTDKIQSILKDIPEGMKTSLEGCNDKTHAKDLFEKFTRGSKPGTIMLQSVVEAFDMLAVTVRMPILLHVRYNDGTITMRSMYVDVLAARPGDPAVMLSPNPVQTLRQYLDRPNDVTTKARIV